MKFYMTNNCYDSKLMDVISYRLGSDVAGLSSGVAATCLFIAKTDAKKKDAVEQDEDEN